MPATARPIAGRRLCCSVLSPSSVLPLLLLLSCVCALGSRPAAAAPLPGAAEPPPPNTTFAAPVVVVEDVSSCVARNTPLPPTEQTDVSAHFAAWLNATREGSSNATCGAALGALAACDSDAGARANYTSLTLADGCCSRACTNALDAALVAPGPPCYHSFVLSLCSSNATNATAGPTGNNTTSQLAAALFGTVQRCLGINATTCEAQLALDGAGLARALTAAVARNNATAAAANSTAAAAPPLTAVGGIVYAAQAPDPSVLVPSTRVPGGVVLADPDEIAVVEASPAPAGLAEEACQQQHGGRDGLAGGGGARLAIDASGLVTSEGTRVCNEAPCSAASGPVPCTPSTHTGSHPAHTPTSSTMPAHEHARRAGLGAAALLLATVLLATTLPGAASAPAYNPALIVPNVTDCPVPNVAWSPEEFSVGSLATVFTPLLPQISEPACQAQAPSLATCAFDGSLGVKAGCCSSECSSEMQKLNAAGCFPVITRTLCTATPEQMQQVALLLPVLLGAAERCAGYSPPAEGIQCPDGRVIPTGAAGAGAGAPAAEAPVPEMGAAPALPGAQEAPAAGARRLRWV